MATIKDVAKHAGVSVATVSRVLNKKGPLSDDAIARVNAAVERLNYCPNLLARSLASGKNNTIGVILPSFNKQIWSEMAQMIEDCASKLNKHIIFSVMAPDSDIEKRFRAVEYLRNLQVNGIIFCGCLSGDLQMQKRLRQIKNLPMALVIDQAEGLPSIVSDDAQGGTYAARHLIAKGCRNIAHVSTDLRVYKNTDDRSYAFAKECELRGVNCRIYENGSTMPTAEEIQTLVNRIFYEYPEVDGMFLKNDILAAECISYVTAQGMRIPGDIRIMGYDDMYFSSLIYPPLTTIRNNCEELAQAAVKSILDQIAGKTVPRLTVIPVELIERKTT